MNEEFNKEALLSEIKELITGSTKDAITEKELNAKVDAINKQLESLNEREDNHEDVKALKDSVEKLLTATSENAGAIKALAEQAKKPSDLQPRTFKEAVKAAILGQKENCLTEKNDDYGKRLSLKEFFEKNGSRASMPEMKIEAGYDLVRKTAVDMLQSNIVQSNVSTVRLTELDPNRVGIPLVVYPHVVNVFPSKNIVKPYMSLLVVYDYEDGAGTKTEGSAGSKSSFLLKTVEFKAFYINTHFILSDETLDDLEEVVDEINMVAPDKIMSSVDGKIFADAGNGTTDIQGLFVGGTTCTDFVASTYENSVDGGNLVDLIAKMKLAVRKNSYKANFIGLNSTDIDRIQCLKDQLDNSISDRRLVFNADGDLVKVAGLSVVENDSITANTCVVGETAQAVIGVRKDLTMEIGYNGSDLTEGQKTIMVKLRLAFGVRDKAAFQYSSNMNSDLQIIQNTNN